MKRLSIAAVAAVVSLCSLPAFGQGCRIQTVTGTGSTQTVVAGFEKSPTAPSNTDQVDASYYQLTNQLGLGPTATTRTMYSNWTQSAAGNSLCANCDPSSSHPVIYGASFINPTNAAISVTRVDFTTNIDHFTPTDILAVAPAAGWQPISNRRLARWGGSVSVAAHSTQDFIFGDSPQNNASNNTTRTVAFTATFTTSIGTIASTPYSITTLTSNNSNASNAVASFDNTGGAIAVAAITVPNKASGGPVNLPIRVGETGNNGNSSAIATNLLLTITVPKEWTSVTVPTKTAPWNAASLSITAPSGGSDWTVTIRTNAAIAPGASTPAGSLVLQGTPPASSVTNLYPVRLALSGVSAGGRTISSYNDSVVQVLQSNIDAINVELLSTAMPAPIRTIDFTATLNMIDGLGTETVTVQALNTQTSTWDTLATLTPGTSNTTTTPYAFGAAYATHIDASRRMKVRFVSTGNTSRTLRIDQFKWLTTLGYTVNNSSGTDVSNTVGDISKPFASITKAATVLGASGAIYVEVGSGAAYAPNIAISGAGQAGISSCRTLIQGVASGAVLPRVRGASTNDAGFVISSNYVTVDSFQVENTGVGMDVEPNTTGTTFSNSTIQQMNDSYGIIVNDNSPSTVVLNNTIDATGFSPLIALYDGSTQTLIDGNKIVGASGEYGIYSAGSSPTIQRNIVSAAYYGIYLGTTGTALVYNNTVNACVAGGIVASNVGIITSRNNIIMRSTNGWQLTGSGSVNSDYDDVFDNYFVDTPSNAHISANYSGVTPGVNSISQDPAFVSSSGPSTANYYRLGGGSPCINAGISVGLPFLGVRPDIGAVESQ